MENQNEGVYIEKLENKIRDQAKRLVEYQNLHKETLNSLKNTNDEISDLKEKINYLQNELENRNFEIQELRNNMLTENLIHTAKIQNHSLKSEYDQLKQAYLILSEKYENSLSQSQNKPCKDQETISKIIEKNDKSQESKMIEKFRKELIISEALICDLQRENTELKEKLGRENSQILEIKKTKDDEYSINERKEILSENENLKKTVLELRNEILSLNKNQELFEKNLDQARKLNTEFENRIGTILKEKEYLSKDCMRINTLSKENEEKLRKYENLKNENELLRKQIKSSEINIQTSSKSKFHSESEAKVVLEEKIDELTEKVKNLSLLNNELKLKEEAALFELTKTETKTKKLIFENDFVKQELIDFKLKHQKLSDSKFDVETKLKEYIETIKDYSLEIERLAGEKEELLSKFIELSKEYETIKIKEYDTSNEISRFHSILYDIKVSLISGIQVFEAFSRKISLINNNDNLFSQNFKEIINKYSRLSVSFIKEFNFLEILKNYEEILRGSLLEIENIYEGENQKTFYEYDNQSTINLHNNDQLKTTNFFKLNTTNKLNDNSKIGIMTNQNQNLKRLINDLETKCEDYLKQITFLKNQQQTNQKKQDLDIIENEKKYFSERSILYLQETLYLKNIIMRLVHITENNETINIIENLIENLDQLIELEESKIEQIFEFKSDSRKFQIQDNIKYLDTQIQAKRNLLQNLENAIQINSKGKSYSNQFKEKQGFQGMDQVKLKQNLLCSIETISQKTNYDSIEFDYIEKEKSGKNPSQQQKNKYNY